MSSVISQSYSFESFLWAAGVASSKALAGAPWGAVVSLPSVVRRLAVIVAGYAVGAWADQALLFSGLLTVLTWCAGIAAIVGALALLLAHPPIVLAGLAIVGYAWLTYPRSKAVR